MERPVVIVEYRPEWPAQAEAEMAAIRAALGFRLRAIEHMGSTSVPGLAAKPIVDLMAGLQSLEDASACVPLMESLGYRYRPDLEADMPERRYFSKDIGGVRAFQVHMVELDGEFWRRHLVFRDALRADPALAAEYAALKRRLAAQYGTDRVGYTEAKTDFIQAVEARGAAMR